MSARLVAITVALAACSTPPPVEELVAERFTACMADAGYEVEDVVVVLGPDRQHIERFDWTTELDVERSSGDACEDEALRQYAVSRT